MTELPKITSCFGVIMEENQIPPRIYLVHNNADTLGPNGEEGKPEGWGLPGGGSEEGETPEDTVKREVLLEEGLLTELATKGFNSEFGEILFEHKPRINNDIFIFHLKKVSGEGLKVIEEISETRRIMLADLGAILKIPLAIKIIPDTKEKIKNPEGIYFSTRERIFGVLEYLNYDFYNLIPDLDRLIKEIRREEVGNYVYNLLMAAVRKKMKIMERRAKFLRPDLDDHYEYQELLERYRPLIMAGGGVCQ
ncbi:MAG: NUDIX hydrolase [Patescibacteria group bacterium]